jgi:hypothetical protein
MNFTFNFIPDIHLHILLIRLHILGIHLHVPDIRLHILDLRLHIQDIYFHIIDISLHIIDIRLHIPDIHLHILDIRLHIPDIHLHILDILLHILDISLHIPDIYLTSQISVLLRRSGLTLVYEKVSFFHLLAVLKVGAARSCESLVTTSSNTRRRNLSLQRRENRWQGRQRKKAKCTVVQALRLCTGRTVKCTVVQALRLCTGRTVKCTLVQALRICTGRTAYRGSRGLALPFHDHGTRRG